MQPALRLQTQEPRALDRTREGTPDGRISSATLPERLTIGQSRKWLVEALEPPDDIGQTGGSPKVLLLQTQLLTDWRRIFYCGRDQERCGQEKDMRFEPRKL